jgi:hypothetical protein
MSRRLSANKFAHQLHNVLTQLATPALAVWEGIRRTHGLHRSRRHR